MLSSAQLILIHQQDFKVLAISIQEIPIDVVSCSLNKEVDHFDLSIQWNQV